MKRVFLNKESIEVALEVLIICRREDETKLVMDDFSSKNIRVFHDKHWDSAKIRLIETHRKELPMPNAMIMSGEEFREVEENLGSLFTEFGYAPPPVVVVEDSEEGKLELSGAGITATMNSWEFKVPSRVLPKILQACGLREDLISE